ncbi:hypothetical protein INR49_001193 [Caranx melampygus]|nr:hypothetical protein INR49_001193 [Caranx melampygus]
MESKSALSWMLLSAWVLSAASGVSVTIRAAPGQTVSLPCRAPSNTDIIVVEWTRPDLEPEYVLMYKDGWSDPDHQHQAFKGRVELEDREMKDGDVSMILKNVTSSDTGTYECRVVLGKTNRRKRATLLTEPISTIYLKVQSGRTEETGDEEGGDEGQWIALRAVGSGPAPRRNPTLHIKTAGTPRARQWHTSSFSLHAPWTEMSAVTPVLLGGTFVSLWFLVSSTDVPVTIRAAPGQTVSLPCRAPSNTDIIVVEWTRPGLEPEYVFLYRDGWSVPENQLPSFKDRVELKDRDMKDGDVSMILKNVTSSDTGTYECRIFQRKTNRRKRATLLTEPISTIYLAVHQPGEVHSGGRSRDGGGGGNKDGEDVAGNIRRRHGLVAVALLVGVCLVSWIVMELRRHMKKRTRRAPPVEHTGGARCENIR